MDLKARLAGLLLEKAFWYAEEPVFKLASGRMSQYYFNCKPVTMSPGCHGKWASTNNATYNGQTNTGIPLNFDHQYETIWTIEADIGYTFHTTVVCHPV
ncbi:MAG: hypothetical protein J7M03_02115 [Candidatus Desulfofervidaceae bacterium]|nr:hypothetical protein [Candidatus Desulfofervidaceae bacterium]MDL1970773.1 hypothetical protein [Candidatus Desulfofervidaceae bacterium]